MHRLDRLTATLLLVAGLGSLALMLSAFVDLQHGCADLETGCELSVDNVPIGMFPA